MPKGRYLDTKFWSDGYIAELDPVEKLLYLYFLTNEKTVISGIYELPLKYMAVETGIEKEMIEKILKRFRGDEKILNIDGWIIIKNFAKHQNTKSEDVVTGIKREFESLPENIQKEALGFGWSIDGQGSVGGGLGIAHHT